jgi:heterodisulfide reductase subunit A-like polyferredoxin
MAAQIGLNLETKNARPADKPDLPVTGAVMVVGGGIAGMQASLDLADQGFRVYLVESKSAIGGNMARLDKTFPTNDCAMCTISPKLVETGRHPNIEILTNTEVKEVSGQAGNFTVQLYQHPRYVDLDKCVACGDCSKECPGIISDEFNGYLTTHRVISKLYPQAVPNAYGIEKRGISPCRDACPAGQRAQGYIALIREGRWQDAMRVIKMDNPFPGICGRICNHRCETACNRGLVDEPINIRALKRFVTDKIYAEPRTKVEKVDITHPDQQVAIIGAGPCGLTAAQDIIRAGFPVTIFEAMPVAGGMLRLGVPEYRLPSVIVDREVQDIVDLGIDLRLDTRVDNLDDLFTQGFSAVLIAVGAHEGVRLRITGANLDGVLVNTHFLRDVRLGKYGEGERGNSQAYRAGELGQQVLVLGGGNVAIDCARTAVRLGRQVQLACVEEGDTIPAHPWEIEAAEKEGVRIYPGRSFERIVGDGHGRVRGVECMRVSSFNFDEGGRLHLEKVPGSEELISCDTVIFSVGQRAGLAFIPADTGVGITDRQTIAINPNTMAATRPGVFAAGDSVSGTAFVIEAVASGHKVAESIIRYLQKENLEPPPRPELPVVHLSQDEISEKIACGVVKPQKRIPLPELPVETRISSFSEVEGGYDDASAQAEAARCLACGVCSECMSCVFACGAKAINHDMVGQDLSMQVGAVILAPGYEVYRAELSEEFGFGRYPNVITSLQFERMLSASGPTMGHVLRPSDRVAPRRIAFLQCIGSRDQKHDYCSAVCCMSATKEAIMTKEHNPGMEIQVFMLEMRAFSKGYQVYFDRARTHYGVHYTRCRVSAIEELPGGHDLRLRWQDEAGRQEQGCFDLVVLSVGMEISEAVKRLGQQLGIALDEYGFCHTVQFNPVETSRPGIYAIGPFREPKDIPESVVEASSAAAAAAGRLAAVRFTLTRTPEFPPERDVSGEPPRIGVFVCHCGTNIGGYLDVPAVVEQTMKLPGVVHAEHNLYTCSQDSIRHLSEQIEALGLNRVVVASCSPLTHQPLFQESLRAARLNPYLFEMANIRNQCSWVHSTDRLVATTKAIELVRMAVGRAARLEAEQTFAVGVQAQALVVGGGAAGMAAALALADQGFPVHLVEKNAELGGNLRHVLIPMDNISMDDLSTKVELRHPQAVLKELIQSVCCHPLITIHLESTILATRGFMGNFTTTITRTTGAREEIQHGATILATGARECRDSAYGYGAHPSILTQQEFETWLAGCASFPQAVRSVAMIQCVGAGVNYCSRICCAVALKNAIALKTMAPQVQVTILYKDIRAYGFKERLYTRARALGVIFIRYDDDHLPQVTCDSEGAKDLLLFVEDPTLGRMVELRPDLLVLSMALVPEAGAGQIAEQFKVSVDTDGFFLEAHVKLRPVDFATDGIFMAGMAHYPKLLDESLIQAQAAAGRAARILSRPALAAGGRVAIVDPAKCTGCLTCVRICPFKVPKIQVDLVGAGGIKGAAVIEAAVCQGCGLCAAECPARAIQLAHYTDLQMAAKLDGLFAVPLLAD